MMKIYFHGKGFLDGLGSISVATTGIGFSKDKGGLSLLNQIPVVPRYRKQSFLNHNPCDHPHGLAISRDSQSRRDA